MKSLLAIFVLFIIAYYFLKALLRLFAIFLAGENKNNFGRWSQKKKSDVTIEYHEKQKKRFDKNSGEYIDYEEIN